MTPLQIGVIAVIAFLVMLFLGVPIPFGMALAGVVGIIFIKSPLVAGQMLANDLYGTFTTYSFTVGPMFGLMGFLASYSGIGANLYKSLNLFLGHKPGGLAMATQVAGAGFGAICGSPPAATSTFAAIAYPEMRKYNYHASLAGDTIAAGSGLSVLIPPSSILIIYGLITENSIGRLFMGGILPGILMLVMNIFAIVWIVKRHPDYAPRAPRHGWKERFLSIKNGGIIEIVIVFIIAMGGMFGGFFTPTEAGAVGAFGMFMVGLFTRKINWKKFTNSLWAAVRLQAMIFMLLACASIFGKLFVISTIPLQIGNFVKGLSIPGWAIMLIIIFIYLFIGMVADLMPMMIITMPIFYPIVIDYLGYDPIWFGVQITILCCVGSLSPPFGPGVFMLIGCVDDKEATVSSLFRGIWPFVIAEFLCAMIILLIPGIPAILPNALYGG